MEILASNTILYCSNWNAMLIFYQEILGFAPTFRKDDWFVELRITEGSHLSLADEARCSIKSAAGLAWAKRVRFTLLAPNFHQGTGERRTWTQSGSSRVMASVGTGRVT